MWSLIIMLHLATGYVEITINDISSGEECRAIRRVFYYAMPADRDQWISNMLCVENRDG
jgi:hypothetical protein